MIEFDQVTFRYPDAARPTFSELTVTIEEGELCLVTGVTGSGKSTLLRAVNGLVPHFTGGVLAGEVRVNGRSTRDHPPRELADVVGFVGQDPVLGFVTDHVEDELAYVMESLGIAEPVMRKRVAETLDLLGLAEVRDRPLASLSGGQQQRVAIGAALTAHPHVLVLDEPTSALDPGAAEEVLAAVHRLVHDLGVTVLLAEHRLERVVQYADRVLWLPGNAAAPSIGEPGAVLAKTPIAPPVIQLARLLDWEPAPVSVRSARQRAARLRTGIHAPQQPVGPTGPTVLSIRGVTARYGRAEVLAPVDFVARAGERIAIMGRNGAGKSTLLAVLHSANHRGAGQVAVNGVDPAKATPKHRKALIALVPQNHSELLYLETVDAECAQADTESDVEPGTCRRLLDRIVTAIPGSAHPRDLSEGQRLAVVLAVMLAAEPAVIALDEPTRGLDYPAKKALAHLLNEFADAGKTIIVTTHDVEFVAEYATRVAVIADGEIVADGPAAEIVTSSPLYAPQMAKVFAPHPLLTVAQVAEAVQTQ